MIYPILSSVNESTFFGCEEGSEFCTESEGKGSVGQSRAIEEKR
jgi:hypothetical protein